MLVSGSPKRRGDLSLVVVLLALGLVPLGAAAQECVTCRTERCPKSESMPDWCGKGEDPLAPKSQTEQPATKGSATTQGAGQGPEASQGASQGAKKTGVSKRGKGRMQTPPPQPALQPPPPSQPAPARPMPQDTPPSQPAPESPSQPAPAPLAPAAPMAVQEQPAPPPQPAAPRHRLAPWKWTTLGVGVAAAGVGAALFAVDNTPTCGAAAGWFNCPQLLRTQPGGYILLSIGGAALVGTTVLFVLDARERRSTVAQAHMPSALYSLLHPAGWGPT